MKRECRNGEYQEQGIKGTEDKNGEGGEGRQIGRNNGKERQRESNRRKEELVKGMQKQRIPRTGN